MSVKTYPIELPMLAFSALRKSPPEFIQEMKYAAAVKRNYAMSVHDNIEMREEYDFSHGVRGKHYRAYRAGHIVRVRKADGSVEERHFTLEDGAVMLDPDLKSRFPTSEAVNKALRSLVARG